jgi:hypothetical protein
MPDLVRDFKEAIENAVDVGVTDGLKEGQRLTSGTIRTQDQVDNPYAKRHGQSVLPGVQINDQASYRLRGPSAPSSVLESWYREPVGYHGGTFTSSIDNDSPLIDWLTHGTWKLAARPVDAETEAFTETQLEKRLQDYLYAFSKRTYQF